MGDLSRHFENGLWNSKVHYLNFLCLNRNSMSLAFDTYRNSKFYHLHFTGLAQKFYFASPKCVYTH